MLPIEALMLEIDIWKLWIGLNHSAQIDLAYSKVHNRLSGLGQKHPALLSRTLCHFTGCTPLQDILTSQAQVVRNFKISFGQMISDQSLITRIGKPHELLDKARNAMAKKNLAEAERWAYLASTLDTSGTSWAFETPEVGASILLGEIYALNNDPKRARMAWNRAYADLLPRAEDDKLNFDGYVSTAMLALYLGRPLEAEVWVNSADEKEPNNGTLSILNQFKLWRLWALFFVKSENAEIVHQRIQLVLNQNPAFKFYPMGESEPHLAVFGEVLTRKDELIEQFQRDFDRLTARSL